jgi:hypothetical protein
LFSEKKDTFTIESSTIIETMTSKFVPWRTSSRPIVPITRVYGVSSSFDKEDLDGEYETMCVSSRRHVNPTTLPNILNKLVTVINNEKLVQTVLIEECT